MTTASPILTITAQAGIIMITMAARCIRTAIRTVTGTVTIMVITTITAMIITITATIITITGIHAALSIFSNPFYRRTMRSRLAIGPGSLAVKS